MSEYRSLRLDASSWDAWEAALARAVAANVTDDNIHVAVRTGVLPTRDLPRRRFWRRAGPQLGAAPHAQVLHCGDYLAVDIASPSLYPWTPAELAELYALGWPEPSPNMVQTLPPQPTGLGPQVAREAATLVVRALRDVAGARHPHDLEVTQANVG